MTIPKREREREKLVDRKIIKSNIHHKTRQSPFKTRRLTFKKIRRFASHHSGPVYLYNKTDRRWPLEVLSHVAFHVGSPEVQSTAR